MDLAISAIASDLANQFISILINRFSSSSCAEEKVERLRHLLLRVETVTEEADARYITNSGMLSQLKILEEAMYGGYYAMHTFKYRPLECTDQEVHRGSSSLYFASPLKRFQTSAAGSAIRNCFSSGKELQSALSNLEAAAANMTEFVILLGGYEHMSRRPYDTYLYVENFMFGRHAEKQHAINILLQTASPPGDNNAPTVLPIIGGCLVGKKTLAAHVCNDNRIRAHFSSILHLKSDCLQITDQERNSYYISGRALVIVELTRDVSDEDWTKLYSSVAHMGKGSKAIVISRLESISRFGTVKPICLDSLSYEEYSYLFKVLLFGNADMDDHSCLASMAHEFPVLMRGSLVSAYAFADVLRKNMSPHFWASILNRCKAVVESNLSIFGEHPKLLLERDHPTDIARFVSDSAAPTRLMTPRSESQAAERPLPKVTFGELVVDPGMLPRGDFDLVTWESRIAPYAKYVHFVPVTSADEKSDMLLPSRKKRPAVFL